MSINLSTFWTTWGVSSGDTTSTNQYDFWRGLIMTGGTRMNSQYDFFKFHNTTRYKFFNDLNSTYPEVWDEYTFYQNTNDARIYDYKTFYQYAAQSLPSSGVTPTPTPTPSPTPTPTPTPTPAPMFATGGTITTITADSKTYRVHTFLTGGTLDVISLGTSTGQVEYLVVAGGAGGGPSHSGGAGAGGLLTGTTNLNVSGYTVFVGSGGTGAPDNIVPKGLPTNGGNSTFAGVLAYGGGGSGFFDGCPYGANPDIVLGFSGGSGGGGSGGTTAGGGPAFGGAGVSGQGFSGGTRYNCPDNGAGGGGAGGAGASVEIDATSGCSGGIGVQVAINGTPTYYAGGGGGGVWSAGTYPRNIGGPGGLGGGGRGGDAIPGTGEAGQPALANTGGGGGGGSENNPGGGNGGSGIVIIRYETF